MDKAQKYYLPVVLYSRLFYGFVALALLATLSFSVFYFFSDYKILVQWYLSLNDCFYKSSSWSSLFFTPAVKQQGNYFALVAMAITLPLLWYAIRRIRTINSGLTLSKSSIHIIWYLLLLGIGILFWSWGNSHVSPAYDEIFSAVNGAEMYPFQALSYYMLPNNHVYFNVVNGTLFSWVHDHVASGRYLSLIAYLLIIGCSYHWLHKQFSSRPIAFIAALLIALQFTTWGFGFQARGYEWQLLCGWVCFLSLFHYIENGDKQSLRINALFCIAGFALIPTFLFYIAIQISFLAVVQIYKRQFKLQVWRYQLLSFAGMFIVYLPALCFSGLKAFTQNDFVKSSELPLVDCLPNFYAAVKYFINACFSFVGGENNPINFLLFFIPCLLILSRDLKNKLYGIFYVLLWLVFITMMLYIRRIPFNRNLIVHYSLSLAMLIYAWYIFAQIIAKWSKRNVLKWIVFMLPALMFAIHLYRTDKEMAATKLYDTPGNDWYAMHTHNIAYMPVGSTVGFSNESFYWFYVCRKKGYVVSLCPKGNETFFIKRTNEKIPLFSLAHYTLLKTVDDDYEVYGLNLK